MKKSKVSGRTKPWAFCHSDYFDINVCMPHAFYHVGNNEHYPRVAAPVHGCAPFAVILEHNESAVVVLHYVFPGMHACMHISSTHTYALEGKGK